MYYFYVNISILVLVKKKTDIYIYGFNVHYLLKKDNQHNDSLAICLKTHSCY
jgi:hypothetical protein